MTKLAQATRTKAESLEELFLCIVGHILTIQRMEVSHFRYIQRESLRGKILTQGGWGFLGLSRKAEKGCCIDRNGNAHGNKT